MKHLKFSIAIPFKVLDRFYILTETIFEDGKQTYGHFSRNVIQMRCETRTMRALFDEKQSHLYVENGLKSIIAVRN